MLNHGQLQNHMADKRTTSVLKILLPIEVSFWTKSRVSPLCRTEHHTFKSECKPTEGKETVSECSWTLLSASPLDLGPVMAANFFILTESFIA